jgi:biotin carboxyl carrier protein
MPVLETPSIDSPPKAALPPTGAPDSQLLQSQLARLVEEGPEPGAVGELRPMMEFLRTLLNARAVALLPASEKAGLASCVITTPGIAANKVARLAASFEGPRTRAQAAPELGADGYTLAVPVLRESAQLYWLVAQMTVPNPRDLQAFLVLLQALAGFILYREQRRATQSAHWALERTSGILEIFRRAGSELDFTKACRIAVDDLRGYLGCDRVYLATKGRAGLRMRAISGMARIDDKSVTHAPYEAAMAESLNENRRMDFLPSSAKTEEAAAHEMLQARTGAARITTLPFARGSGAALLEWTEAAPDAPAAALLEASAPFVPALFDLLARARPNPAVFAAHRLWARLNAQRRRAAVLAAVALAALLAFPFHYDIKADCRLAPTVKRVIAAPFEGILKKSFVQPGDRVEKGEPLAEMDNRDLKLKEAELIAARERAMKQRDKALTNQGEGEDFSTAQVADLEAQSVGRDLDLVQRKISQLAIKAPLSGVVLSGDLRRAEGLPVQQGQVLFEVAPLDRMIVEIDVPDREISRVQAGEPLRLRLEAFGGEQWYSRLDKVHPQSEQRDGRNVFVCEAAMDNTNRALDLRPGMRGRAIIQSGRRPLLWTLTHRLWEFVVNTLFW